MRAYMVSDSRFAVSESRASEIMSGNCLGIKDLEKHFGVKLSRQEIQAVSKVPFTEEILQKCSQSHLLFFRLSHEYFRNSVSRS